MDSSEAIKDTVAETLVEASTTFRDDQILAYEKAVEAEGNANARWVLERILENARLAASIRKPLCNDTGIPHVFLDIGEEAMLPSKMFHLVQEGITRGLRKLPGRPMAVRGEALARIGQNEGLFEDSSMVVPAPLQIRMIPGRKILVTVIMLGGGPDIRGRTHHIFHRHQASTLLGTAARWAAEEVSKLGCTPAVPFIGIGRTHYEATCLMLEAMKGANFLEQNELERNVTETVNETRVGPLGFGGKTTALASFIRVGPLRAGGTRIVSMRLGCCWEPRRATQEIPI